MGALLAILVWYPLATCLSYLLWLGILFGLIILFTILGAWSSTVAERYWGEDPSRVVIDEVVGQWITLLAVPAVFSWWHVLAAFILFRFFDIVKPLGVRQMENFKSGWGIMADDILAGIYGAIILYLITAIPW
jgi:phosphatidylglycerophosphatase A